MMITRIEFEPIEMTRACKSLNSVMKELSNNTYLFLLKFDS